MSRALRNGLRCAGIFAIGIVAFVGFGIRDLDRSPGVMPGSSALKAIDTVDIAQLSYYLSYQHYAESMLDLGPSGTNLIDRDLANGSKDGYRFTLTATPAGYAISAAPDHPGVTSRSYFSDQRMRIHVHVGPGTATENDPTVGKP